jgi:CDP-diacylglycerol---glycerol-3-phosphate 3-phosphatidyltransferase
MNVDLACSLLLIVGLVVLGCAYGIRVLSAGRARHDRVESDGGSAVLSKQAMEMFYWLMQPIAEAMARWGISANQITAASLVFGIGSGIAVACHHPGLGALLATICAIADALDGLVARVTKQASDAGEVFDAAVDRYVELAFLGGMLVLFRANLALLVLTLAAIAGSFMVSYSSAKAEALQVKAPRGTMRRSERAVVTVLGAAMTPIAAAFHPSWDRLPMTVALGVVAVLANYSAIIRLVAIAKQVRKPAATPRNDEPNISPDKTKETIETAVHLNTG